MEQKHCQYCGQEFSKGEFLPEEVSSEIKPFSRRRRRAEEKKRNRQKALIIAQTAVTGRTLSSTS